MSGREGVLPSAGVRVDMVQVEPLDEVTLRAFEQCSGRGVRVLSDNEQNPVINPTFEGPLEDTITITHYGEVHYNGTKPIRA
jgi:hypothetical protein